MRKGMTLIEALIAMVVIAVLSTLGYIGAEEYIASAKATKIIMNLHTLKKALWAWYVDNRDKVQSDGRVKMNLNGDPQPIQQWQRNSDNLKLSNYLKRFGTSGIKFYQTSKDETVTGRQRTDLVEGYYGICDGGTSRDSKGNETASYRNNWYAGYRFKSDEAAVRQKILGRLESSGGLWLGTADAHETPKGDNSQAVWLKVR
ncbi:MAG: type II secretion system protein [Synergistaceae bacterium]|nr:type II secretion system protein [Synergistaceae bacterium]